MTNFIQDICHNYSSCNDGHFCNFRGGPGDGYCENCEKFPTFSSCLEFGNPKGPVACINSCVGNV